MEVKAKHPEIPDRRGGLPDGDFALDGVDGGPGLEDTVAILVAQAGHVLVGARRGGRGRLDVEGHEHGLHVRVGEVLDDLVLALGGPRPIPVLGQRLHVGPLGRDPRLGVRIAVEIDPPHQARLRWRPMKSRTSRWPLPTA